VVQLPAGLLVQSGGEPLADDKARYSYDAFNRTEKVETFDGHIQLNRYDAEGLRYEMEENGNLVQFMRLGTITTNHLLIFILGTGVLRSPLLQKFMMYLIAKNGRTILMI